MNSIMYRSIGTLIDLTHDNLIDGVVAEGVFLDILYGEDPGFDPFDGYSKTDCDRMDAICDAITKTKRYSKRLSLEGKGKLFFHFLGM